MTKKIILKNGCSCSTPSVFPKNWRTSHKSSLKKKWRIQYYFYDSNYPKPKLVVIKGMNRYGTLKDRRTVTKILLENEIENLTNKNFNPFKKSFVIESKDRFLDDIKIVLKKLSGSKHHVNEKMKCIEKVEEKLIEFGLESIKTNKLTTPLLTKVLESQNLSNYSFNKL